MPNDDPSELSSLSFLVIEDDSVSEELIVRVLGGLGATDIATASNGVEALDHLDSADRQPDVMLVDLIMPEMSGVELLRHLADREYGGAVVLVSGADEDTLVIAQGLAKSRDLNLLGYITKPVTRQTLSAMLAKLE